MVFSHSAEEEGLKVRSGAPLTKVNEFKYLGSWLTSDITCEKDVKARKAQAWIARHKLRGIWTSKLPRSKKIRVFRALVESILIYGSNTCTLTKSMEKSLDGFYIRVLRISGAQYFMETAYYKELNGELLSVWSYLKESERLV